MRVKYHQNKNGVGQLNEVSNIQMNNLKARRVEKEEVINNHNSDVKVRVEGTPKYDEFGMLINEGE